MNPSDYKKAEKITILCIIGNVLLSAGKLLAGIFGKSEAMIADALHSVSDIIATCVALISIRIAKKPVDTSHPYGHGKIEPIAASFIGIALVFAAFLIVRNMIESFLSHAFATPNFIALAAAVLSIVTKEAMYRATFAAGNKINSQSVIADAWHHRSDALSSIGAFAGILGSMAGNWLGIDFLKYLDPVAGIIVACMIFKVAYDILRRALKELMDSAPDTAVMKSLRDTAFSIEGVLCVNRVKARYVGRHLYVDMEVEVDAQITVEAGHAIAHDVKQLLLEHVRDVADVLVHIEPTADASAIAQRIKGILAE